MTAKTIEALLVASDTAVTLASEAREAERRRCLLIIEEVNAHARYHVTAAIALAMVHRRISEGTPHDGASHAALGNAVLSSLYVSVGHVPRFDPPVVDRPKKKTGIAMIALRILMARIKLVLRRKEIDR